VILVFNSIAEILFQKICIHRASERIGYEMTYWRYEKYHAQDYSWGKRTQCQLDGDSCERPKAKVRNSQ